MAGDRFLRPARAAFGPGSADLSRGTDQSGVRIYNERLVLSLIRGHGSLPQAEISRLTGLSPQTCSVIMKQLEADGIVRRGERQKGRIGQPSVPFSLDPDGALAFGLKIGRRSSDLILVDLVGEVRCSVQETYAYPTPDDVLRFVNHGIETMISGSSKSTADRIAGLGIAVPNKLWSWHEEIGAPSSVLNDWRDFDIAGELAQTSDWPLHFCNDATAACAAELTFGNTTGQPDFIYFFVGTFVGGGVALNGSLFTGPTGNAGAVGPMPIAPERGANGQLIHNASLYVLEDSLREAGRDPSVIWRTPADWGDMGPILDKWIDDTSHALALAILSAITVIDFGATIIDGAMPSAVRRRIVERTTSELAKLDQRGLSPVTILEGTIGAGAQAKGAASLPLLANFARDRDVLFKDTAPT